VSGPAAAGPGVAFSTHCNKTFFRLLKKITPSPYRAYQPMGLVPEGTTSFKQHAVPVAVSEGKKR
jgi:hypothetical protein